jgi:hypothetical protein
MIIKVIVRDLLYLILSWDQGLKNVVRTTFWVFIMYQIGAILRRILATYRPNY